MRPWMMALSALTLLAAGGCSAPDAAKSSAPPEKTAAAEPPAHNWILHEGQEYGYPAAVSEDAKKAGQGAADVMMYRYLGEQGGVYSVQAVDNGLTATASCANPCSIVTMRSGGLTRRVTYSASTVVGSVLEDAFNGQLEVYRPEG